MQRQHESAMILANLPKVTDSYCEPMPSDLALPNCSFKIVFRDARRDPSKNRSRLVFCAACAWRCEADVKNLRVVCG